MAMGGVGEAMLLGAAMGGGAAALTGGDPLKGALLGGLTGGAGAGISSLLPGTAAVAPGVIAPAVTPAAATLAPEIAASTAATNAVLPQTVLPPASLQLGPLSQGVTPSGITSLTSFDSFGNVVPINSPAYSMADPTGLAQQQLNLNTAATQFMTPGSGQGTFMEGMGRFAKDPIASLMRNKPTAFSSALAGATGAKKKPEEPEEYDGPLKRYKFDPDFYRPASYADGGIADLGGYDRIVGERPMYMSNMASGGISDLGSYSDGGRMLRGPGDGMSDDIPASISGKRPARLADGEFVVPADVVSHLGNGSTDAGAKQLYAMMDKVRKARTGRKAQGREINPRQYMAA